MASPKSAGTVPVENEVLKIISNGFEITDLRSFSISVGMPDGPAAFPLLRPDISSSISELVVGNMKKVLLAGSGDSLLGFFD